MSETSRLLKVKEVCQRLGISRWTLDALRRAGQLVPVQLSTGGLRYRSFDVERYINRLKPAK